MEAITIRKDETIHIQLHVNRYEIVAQTSDLNIYAY